MAYLGNKGNGAVGQHQQCTWRNALEIKPNIWSEPFDRAIGEDDGGEEDGGYDVDHQIRKLSMMVMIVTMVMAWMKMNTSESAIGVSKGEEELIFTIMYMILCMIMCMIN